MSASHLRPSSSRSCAATDLREQFSKFLPSEKVTVSAGETLALLLHASRTNRTWLHDFTDEEIEVSQDMYEILLAYKRIATEENARVA